MPGRDKPTLVVAALPEELAPILRRARELQRAGKGRVFRGRLGGVQAVFAVTGDGPRAAQRVAAMLCRDFGPAALYGAGIAGALSPNLAAGDLLVARRVRAVAAEAPDPDAGLLERSRLAGNPAVGLLLTVDRPVVDPRQKAALHAALALTGEEPAAVDMESAGWARAAAEAGVPYAVVRAIADTAGEALPEYLPRCVGPGGGIRRAAVVALALAHPASLPALFAMRRRLIHSAEKLAAFLERMLSENA